MAPFVLASASPRRRALLASAGLRPEVRPADVDETPRAAEAPVAYALRVALDKAAAVHVDGGPPVLAADTVVALDGACLGKGSDPDEARRMLRALSGRSHAVHTAVVVRAEVVHCDVVTTEVRFRRLGEAEIERYVATGEPRDKAGAYGIQGEGGALVASVRGSYSNVVGLPLEETLRLLALVGVAP